MMMENILLVVLVFSVLGVAIAFHKQIIRFITGWSDSGDITEIADGIDKAVDAIKKTDSSDIDSRIEAFKEKHR